MLFTQYPPSIGQYYIKSMCQVKWQIVWRVHCFCPPLPRFSLPSVLAFCLFFDFANFSCLSLLYPLSHSLSVKLVFSLLMFSLCSHYGLNPPSLAPFLCSSSWRLQLCSSLLLAFLVRYRYSFSTLFVSPLPYAHIFWFRKTNCLVFPVSIK